MSGIHGTDVEMSDPLPSSVGMLAEARNSVNKKNSKVNAGPNVNNENSANTNHSGEDSLVGSSSRG
jgi:hypothetical protein